MHSNWLTSWPFWPCRLDTIFWDPSQWDILTQVNNIKLVKLLKLGVLEVKRLTEADKSRFCLPLMTTTTNLHTDPGHPGHKGECLRLFLCKLSSQAVALNAYSPFRRFYFQSIPLYSNSVCILFDFYFRDFFNIILSVFHWEFKSLLLLSINNMSWLSNCKMNKKKKQCCQKNVKN